MVATGIVEKTHNEYRAVQRRLVWLRRQGAIPYSWITDSTRYILHDGYISSSLEDALERTITHYRRDLWVNTPDYVEIWAESDAVDGVLNREANRWGAPVAVFRGYSSISFLNTLAEQFEIKNRPAFVYHFGDWDPSGRDIFDVAVRDVKKDAPTSDVHFERVAVTPEQIRDWQLLTSPPKKSDSRSKGFEGGVVEIEAIPPAQLRAMVRGCIERHIDAEALHRSTQVEKQERATLRRVLAAGLH